jgi:hypothetical protein
MHDSDTIMNDDIDLMLHKNFSTFGGKWSEDDVMQYEEPQVLRLREWRKGDKFDKGPRYWGKEKKTLIKYIFLL